ncbi:MAG: hypothetical protein LBI43_00495 [Streptococcaceae bacterium]|jgi:hypothetical protein|nr:hypothetical protein [Streptococcaceae bacterium]
MSINKIMALVGAICYSFMPLIMLLATFGTSTPEALATATINLEARGYTAQQATMSAHLATVVYPTLAFITLLICIANWIAFVMLDGKRGRAWKVYLLVSGILACVSILGIIPGVFFILAFALNRAKDSGVVASQAMAFETSPSAVVDEDWNRKADAILHPSESASEVGDTVSEKSVFSEEAAVLESESVDPTASWEVGKNGKITEKSEGEAHVNE